MYNITLSGKMEIPHKLDEDKDISFVCKRAGLTSINRKPVSVDGQEEDVTYKYKNLDEITILYEDKIVYGQPKKGSQSQVLRNVIKKYWEQEYSGKYEEEEFYKKEMSKIIEEYKLKLL